MKYPTPAQDTTARLHDATRDGVALLIPGALEIRARPQHPVATAVITTPVASPAAGDRGRLEHEREGGGAPSERTTGRYGLFGRLCHCVLHPTDFPTLWGPPRER